MANPQGAPIRGTNSQRQPTRAESAAAIVPAPEPKNKPDQASTHPFMNPGSVELRRGLQVTTR